MNKIRDILFLSGIGSLFAGAWMIYPPAALIVIGTIAVAASIWGYLR